MTGPTLQLREVIDLTNSSPFSSAGTKYSGLDFWEACYRHDRVFFVVNHQFHGPGLRQTLGRAKETVAETSQGRVNIRTHLLFKNIFATSFFSNPNTQTLRISYLVTCCSVKTIVIKKKDLERHGYVVTFFLHPATTVELQQPYISVLTL